MAQSEFVWHMFPLRGRHTLTNWPTYVERIEKKAKSDYVRHTFPFTLEGTGVDEPVTNRYLGLTLSKS